MRRERWGKIISATGWQADPGARRCFVFYSLPEEDLETWRKMVEWRKRYPDIPLDGEGFRDWHYVIVVHWQTKPGEEDAHGKYWQWFIEEATKRHGDIPGFPVKPHGLELPRD